MIENCGKCEDKKGKIWKFVSKNKLKKQTFSSVFCADKRRKPAKNDILTKTK